jgi:photosystem II stability/assembly factor-like uncharacterized protein/ElaB/YqjD/DUF883 family membrane-anchored ribosome-binding protein
MGLPESERISDIIIHPTDPNVVFVAVQGQLWGSNEERGVYITEDGGHSWNRILYLDEHTGCADLAIDPEDPNVLYAAMWSHRRYPDFFDSGLKHKKGYTNKSGLYKSTDGGKTWSKKENGLTNAPKGRIAIAVAPTNKNKLYATVEMEDEKARGLYTSEDAGENWERVTGVFGVTVRPFYFSRLEVSPHNDSTLLKAGLNLSISNDGGKSFRTVGSGVHSDIHCMWVDPNNEKHIIAGTDGGVYESYDGGYLFKMYMNLPVSQFYHVSVDNAEPFNVYGGLQDNGSWYAPSQKAGGITNSDWKSTFGGDGFYSFAHKSNPDIIYSEYQGGQMVRYNKKTGQAKDIKPYPSKGEEPFRYNWNAPIHLSETNTDRLYFGAQYLFMSEDMGDSWKRISGDLTTNDKNRQRQKLTGGLTVDNSTAENNTTIYANAEAYEDENTIWVGTDDGNLQVTDNQGNSWENVVENIEGLPEGNWVSFIEPGRFDGDVAFVTFDNHRNGDKKPYVFKTSDLGKTWKSITTSGIEGYALSIRQDMVNPNLLFLGTEFGLYISLDGGESWTRFENNMPKVGVRDMVIQPKANALVMGTHGRGVIIIDDISPLRQITPEVLNENLVFFETKPTILRDPGAGGGWFGGAGNFVGPNPNRSAQIVYYMKKRHTFGKMYVEIFDQSGNLLKELPAGKSGGINKVTMPTSLPKPKAAPTDNRMALFGSMSGPNLEEGTYKVVLTKGKQKYETSFELKYDENSPYTSEDRALQAETVMKLYDLTQDMAYVHHVLKSISDQSKELASANSKMAKKLKSLQSKCDEYRNSLVAMGGDGYVNEGEAIRERISNLYRQVIGYPGRPSQSQINRTDVLMDDMKEIYSELDEIINSDVTKVNKALTKKNESATAIVIQSKEEFLSDDKNKSGSGGSYEEWLELIK